MEPGTLILHSRADDVVPFGDSVELLSMSGLPESALIEVGQDHRLADPEPLEALLRAVESRKVDPRIQIEISRPVTASPPAYPSGPGAAP